MTKDDAKMLWATWGKMIAGGIFMGVGLMTTLKGSINLGVFGTMLTMRDAVPEEFEEIAKKMVD